MFLPQMNENIVQSNIQGFVESTTSNLNTTLNLGYTVDKQKLQKFFLLLNTIAEFKIVNVIILTGIGPMLAGFYKSYKAAKQ